MLKIGSGSLGRRRWVRRAALAIAACLPLAAHDPTTTKVTWSREISRLMFRRCGACHGPGGPAMSLATYEDARPWAKAIKEQTLSRAMPPWGAVKGFGAFQNDGGLSQTELALIADWVEGGAPLGDPTFLPKFEVPVPAAAPRFRQSLAVTGTLKLARPVTLVGLRPSASSDALQVIARLPGGRIVPLLQLYRYDVRFAHDFQLATPLPLPAGTVIEGVRNASETVLLLVNPGSSPAR